MVKTVTTFDEYKQRGKDAAKKSNEQRANVPLTAKGQKIKNIHPAWDNDICNTVGAEKIKIGMTAEQVIASWGKPYKVNQTIGSYGTHEQWVMYDTINSDYLYFENGKLTSMQRSQ